MSSLKGNIILNYINTLSGLIFPVVTFPYAARVLQPEGIGVVNFQNSIIGYVVLLTSLGIPLYAVREIAKCRNDENLRNRTMVEITILSVIFALIGYLAVYVIGVFVPRIQEELSLFYILSLTIIFTALGVQWFYQGIEDFLFITVRGLIIRFLCAISLFIFVKDKDDLLLYGLVVVGSTVGNNLINFIHLRKYIRFYSIEWRKLNVTKHIKPAFRIFMLTVITSIYVQLNTIMLGFMVDDRSVGLFTAGYKLTHILVSVVTSLGTVMLPRCSHLIGERKFDEFNNVIKKSYHFMMFMSIPLTLGIMMMARPITILFCGADYIDAVPVVIFTAPVIIFIGLTNIIGIQVLYPYSKENIVIISTLVAAVLNIFLNLLLIPLFSEAGSAISLLLSEFSVLLVQIALGKKYIPFTIIDNNIRNYILGTVIMSLCITLTFIVNNEWLRIFIGSIIGATVYLSLLYKSHDYILQDCLSLLLKKIKRT